MWKTSKKHSLLGTKIGMLKLTDFLDAENVMIKNEVEEWIEDGRGKSPASVDDQLLRSKRIIVELAEIIDNYYYRIEQLKVKISTLREQFESRSGVFASLNEGDEDFLLGSDTDFYDVCIERGINYDNKEDPELLLKVARSQVKEIYNNLYADLNRMCGSNLLDDKSPKERILEYSINELSKP